MSQEIIKSIKEWIVIFVVVAIVMGLFIGVFNWVNTEVERTRIAECERKSALLRLPTKSENTCWVEIKPDLWVRADDILWYIHLLKEE